MYNFFNINHTRYLFLLALGLILQGCENDEGRIVELTRPDKAPLESVSGLQTLYSDSGVIKVKVTAPVLNKYLSPKPLTELPKGLSIDFYDNNLNVVSKLSAKYAIHYEREKRWMAKNDVVVVNEKGEQLNTEKLWWDESSEKIHSDEFVRITTPEEIIMGKGFEANQDFSTYKIYKVTGNITIKE